MIAFKAGKYEVDQFAIVCSIQIPSLLHENLFNAKLVLPCASIAILHDMSSRCAPPLQR